MQTKESASRALAQIMVEESIRGIAIQQGMLKSCAQISIDENHPVS